MAFINKEKVLNGVGKAVDVTNKTVDKVEGYVKEKELDKKFENAAPTLEEGLKSAGEKLEDIQNEMRQMRGRIEAMRMRARTKMHPRQLHMMLRNPSARSFKYQEGWRYLKNKMSRGEDNEKK